jgi:hypothetical protein
MVVFDCRLVGADGQVAMQIEGVYARAIGIDPGDLSTLEDSSVLDAIDPVQLG